MDSITIEVDLELEAAWQLAQFCKRVGFSEFRQNAVNNHDAYIMQNALDQVAKALAQNGYEPR